MKSRNLTCSGRVVGICFASLAAAALPLLLDAAADTIAQQAYIKASNTGLEDYFGSSVAVSGDTMVIGAYGERSNAVGVNGDQTNDTSPYSGAAYVFVRRGTNWVQQAYLKASNNDGEYDLFGVSVAVSGDTVVVGAPFEDSNATNVNGNQDNDEAAESGAAYVFVRSGTNWTQQAYLKPFNAAANQEFGGSVAISGDIVVVGARREDSDATGVNGEQGNANLVDSGAAYVFVRNGTNWSQQAYFKASNPGYEDFFGETVSVSADTIVVGASKESSDATEVNGNGGNNNAYESGAAYIFVRSGTNWTQQAYLKASNAETDDHFGGSVSVSGDTVVVGALSESSKARGVNGNQNDNSAYHAGAAYIFVRTGTNWNQQAYVKASNAQAGDAFGFPVALSGETLAIGAGAESSSATGINGNQRDNSAFLSGAAYVFVRSGTNWNQQAYLKASNTGGGIPSQSAGDAFALVSVSGDTVVVGAGGEDSSATGINGEQNDNGTPNSGAAYVFTGLGLGVFPDANGGYSVRFKGYPSLTYGLERSPVLSGSWTNIATAAANGFGIVSFYDTNAPPGQAFYRTVQH